MTTKDSVLSFNSHTGGSIYLYMKNLIDKETFQVITASYKVNSVLKQHAW